MASASSSWPSQAVEIGHLHPAADLQALHTYLVLRFRAMLGEHQGGSAFVCPFPDPHDVSPHEILVVPARIGAAAFSIGLLERGCTAMVVRMGEQGVLECSEDEQSTASLVDTAEKLFNIALRGRYREQTWIHPRTGRRVCSQPQVLDESGEWQMFGPPRQASGPPRLLGRDLILQERTYEPY